MILNSTDLGKLNLVTFGNGGLVLGSSQFLLLLQLPQKTKLYSRVVKSDIHINNHLNLLI